jgi:hypothetical protein
MNRADAPALRASVVYLRPGLVFERSVVVPKPATIGAAVDSSGVRSAVAELAEAELAVGVFGDRRLLSDPLRDGDRVEIYRPLAIDPKEARRVRVTVRRRRRTAAAR